MTRKAAVQGLRDLSEPTLLRIENGEINFRRNVGNLRQLLKRYQVTDDELIKRRTPCRSSAGSVSYDAPIPVVLP